MWRPTHSPFQHQLRWEHARRRLLDASARAEAWYIQVQKKYRIANSQLHAARGWCSDAQGLCFSADLSMSKSNDASGRKRVLVIGAGAAGMAAAWSLGRFPDRFEVVVWEAAPCAGGVATSEDVGDGVVINDGVQGGAVSYRNTLLLHEQLGFQSTPVHMKISFGKGSAYWGNYGEETELIRRLGGEIKRFEGVLRWIGRLEPLFVALPISLVLRVFRFSKDFQERMVYPLVALFFGTGNQTHRVSSVLFARVFLDPQLRLFDYDPKMLLAQSPQMFAFAPLRDIYKKFVEATNAEFHFGRKVAAVDRAGDAVLVQDVAGARERFDEVVFAGNAEGVLKMMARPSRLERFVLGNVQYYDDITVTHGDLEYMRRHYEIDLARPDQYFIKTYDQDPGKCEMSFMLNNYQPHVSGCKTPVFQTIFLDERDRHLWTIDEIQEDKVCNGFVDVQDGSQSIWFQIPEIGFP